MKKGILIFLVFTSLLCNSQSGYAKHYLAGITISGLFGSAINYGFKAEKPILSSFLGSVCGTLVGIAKEEIYDRQFKKGTPSNQDKIYTTLGSNICFIQMSVCVWELRKHKK